MQTVWTWLTDVDILAVIAGVVAVLYGLVKRIDALQRWKLGRAMAFLEAGVQETYEGYVRTIKASRVDGKLTDAERSEAVRKALSIASTYAKEEGIDLLKYYAKAYLPVLVEKIVARKKVALPLDLLPEWEPTSR